MFTWVYDAPTGVYKQHAMSMHMYDAALEESKFVEHVLPVDGYGKGRGENVTLTRVANITEPTSATLSETDRVSVDDFSLSTTSITVVELGRAIEFTSLSNDLSEFNVENPIQRKLRAQMALTLDTKASDAFQTAKIKYAPTGLASNNIATAGTFGAAATANMNIWHCEEIRDYLYDTLHCPMIGDSYIGIFRTLGLRGLKRDPDWVEWHKYTDPASKFNSEVGRMEEIRFIETNHANALGKVGTGSVLGEGVVFGEDSVAMAEAQTPELRVEINVGQDFGRSHAVAWYGVLEFGIIWDTGNAGQARIVHVGST
jgi:N4-gp56 family major capsid protein